RVSRWPAAPRRGQGPAHRQLAQRDGRGALPRVPPSLSLDCAARAAGHARLLSGDDARDRQPDPQETVASVGRTLEPTAASGVAGPGTSRRWSTSKAVERLQLWQKPLTTAASSSSRAPSTC